MSNPVTNAMLELARIKERNSTREGVRFSGAYTLMLFALIVAALMVALLFGTTAYSAINSSRVADDGTRASLSVISNSIRQADTPDSIKKGKGPEGRSLVLVENTKNGVYETRYYVCNGELLQEYSRASAKVNPADAVHVADTDTFKFSIDDNMVTFTTDQGTASVALRSSLSLEPAKGGEDD